MGEVAAKREANNHAVHRTVKFCSTRSILIVRTPQETHPSVPLKVLLEKCK